MPNTNTKIKVEPFILVNLVDASTTPTSTTFKFEDKDTHSFYPYVASTVLGVYVPQGTVLVPNDDNPDELINQNSTEYAIQYTAGGAEPGESTVWYFNPVERDTIKFTAVPNEHWTFNGWANSYTVAYQDPIEEGYNPSYKIQVSSTEESSFSLIFPESDLISGVYIDDETEARTTPTAVYFGQTVKVKLNANAKCSVGYNGDNFKNYNTGTSNDLAYEFTMPNTETTINVESYTAITFTDKITGTMPPDMYHPESRTDLYTSETEHHTYDSGSDIVPANHLDEGSPYIEDGDLVLKFHELNSNADPVEVNWHFEIKNNDPAVLFDGS